MPMLSRPSVFVFGTLPVATMHASTWSSTYIRVKQGRISLTCGHEQKDLELAYSYRLLANPYDERVTVDLTLPHYRQR